MRRLCSLFIISLFTLGCATPQPTLAPIPTVTPSSTPEPSATPPRSVCVFRNESNVEVGVYRFEWNNIGIKLNTRIGTLNVDGAKTLKAGWRQLIIVHNKRLPESFGVAINFDVNQTLLFDPTLDAQEVRDAGGTVIAQSVNDVPGHHGGMPAYLDIARVEREFGYYPNSTSRIYLADVQPIPQVWNYQTIGVTLGKESFHRRSYADGRIELLTTISKGTPSAWQGTVKMLEPNVFSFEVQTGWDQAMQAFTGTSSGEGDSVLYPMKAMKELWEGARKYCP
ncbi:MAG: hypothetical protein HZB52_11685 [Chloroflexi bacterium]|nr:hypothetical protein [Chloroflexota bacterium]